MMKDFKYLLAMILLFQKDSMRKKKEESKSLRGPIVRSQAQVRAAHAPPLSTVSSKIHGNLIGHSCPKPNANVL